MPTATAGALETAVHIYKRNAGVFAKSIDGLTAEEWLRRPGPESNPILWIAGHVVWARSRALGILGCEWSRPWLPLFARGARLADDSQFPSYEEIVSAWEDVSKELNATLETVSADKLSAPSPDKAPSFDGTLGGTVGAFAFHESYHMGQMAYLRSWLGHEGALG